MKRFGLRIETFPLEEEKLTEALLWSKGSVPATHREHEWLAGRYCAKKALEEIGACAAKPLGSFNRMPIWPEGVSGSISHTQSTAIAVAGANLFGAGIDCEVLMDHAQTKRRAPYFVREEETPLVEMNPELAPTLIFSAKEALFKCFYPRCYSYFGMLEAKVVSFGNGIFEIDLDSNRPAVSKLKGRHKGGYQVWDDKIITWVLKDNH